MARYRKIDPKLWGDAKFRQLSHMAPSGQGLWLYLLTGPHTNVIPGLFRATEQGLAAELGWTLEAFRDAFKDALTQGMCEADWEAKIVSIPNVIKYDPPQSINVVKAWKKVADELPECELKDKHLRELLAYLDGKCKAFAKAFRDSWRMTKWIHTTPTPTPTPNKETPIPPKGGEAIKPPKPRRSKAATLLDDSELSEDDRVLVVHWRTCMGINKAKVSRLDVDRISQARDLTESLVEEYGGNPNSLLWKAIKGCSLSRFHMGENETGAKHNALKLIFQDIDHMRRFLDIESAQREGRIIKKTGQGEQQRWTEPIPEGM